MKTKREVEVEFRSDLRELLKKWNAEIESNPDNGDHIEVNIRSLYDDKHIIREYTHIDLGRWVDG